MKKVYRVECNFGSKYFESGVSAFAYFEQMKTKQMTSVELWLVIKERTPKLYSVTQELIAYSPNEQDF